MIRITLPNTGKQKTLGELEAKPGAVAVTNGASPVPDDPNRSGFISLWKCDAKGVWRCVAGYNDGLEARPDGSLSSPALLLPPGTEIAFTVGGGA